MAWAIAIAVLFFATRAPDPSPAPPTAVPRLDARTQARLRALVRSGRARGLRPDAFAKFGDSMTSSSAFLHRIALGYERFPEHPELAPVIDFFSRSGSFGAESLAAFPGWSADEVLKAGRWLPRECGAAPTPLECELALRRPAFALIQFGTNDLASGDLVGFRRSLERIVRVTLAAQVVPLVGTIPPRLDSAVHAARVSAYNDVIRLVARLHGALLIDYWLAMAEPVAPPLKADGIHPSLFGYRLKDLIVLQTLAKLKRMVLEDGPPDR